VNEARVSPPLKLKNTSWILNASVEGFFIDLEKEEMDG
jgi:hypothetical protein